MQKQDIMSREQPWYFFHIKDICNFYGSNGIIMVAQSGKLPWNGLTGEKRNRCEF